MQLITKSELFWSSGNQNFPSFPTEIKHIKDGVELLGSLIFGSSEFYNDVVANRVGSVLYNQSLLSDIHNPQIELLLLHSLGSCKVNSLLRTVPPDKAELQWNQFDM